MKGRRGWDCFSKAVATLGVAAASACICYVNPGNGGVVFLVMIMVGWSCASIWE